MNLYLQLKELTLVSVKVQLVQHTSFPKPRCPRICSNLDFQNSPNFLRFAYLTAYIYMCVCVCVYKIYIYIILIESSDKIY